MISLFGLPQLSRVNSYMYLYLLIGCDGTEDDLREALSGKHPKADATDDAAIFDKGKGLVLPVKVEDVKNGEQASDDMWYENIYLRVKHQSCDVLFGHAR